MKHTHSHIGFGCRGINGIKKALVTRPHLTSTNRTIFFVRRKTIYEYHRMDMKDNKIRSASAIYFKVCSLINSVLALAGHLKMSFLGFLYFHKLLEEGPIFLHEEEERNVFPETSLKALPMIFVWFLYGRTNLTNEQFFYAQSCLL